MRHALRSMFTSKKFIASLAGVVVSLVGTIGIDLPADSIMAILSPLMAYIVGQGVADAGKEKAKIEKQSQG